MNIKIRAATLEDQETVFSHIGSLIFELIEDNSILENKEKFMPSIIRFLTSDEGVYIFLAENDDNDILGLITINECKAIYAGGNFGEISELFVKPAYRSAGVGEKLIAHATKFGRDKEWPFLEVGMAHMPKWQKTYNFYTRNKFVEIGPRLELQI